MRRSILHIPHSSRGGQSLAEILVAIALAAIFFGGALLIIASSLVTSRSTRDYQTAVGLAEEVAEGANVFGETNWQNLYALEKESPYFLATVAQTNTAPVFKLSTTDPEGDDLYYKVSIYSSSTCAIATIVQENDQELNQAGWSQSAPYASGAQGTYTTQTLLAADTTYFWRGSAKDPNGSDTFTDSSNCAPFETTL